LVTNETFSSNVAFDLVLRIDPTIGFRVKVTSLIPVDNC